MSKPIKTAMNLKQFLMKQQVIKLYKDFLRTIKQVPDETSRYEIKQWLRNDFQLNKSQIDEMQIKMSIQYGKRSLKELKNSLELSGNYHDRNQ
jgi:bacillopeptidase F (M6 metalloprotease family)